MKALIPQDSSTLPSITQSHMDDFVKFPKVQAYKAKYIRNQNGSRKERLLAPVIEL